MKYLPRALAILWLIGLGALIHGLQRPAPLFVNVGAGDRSFTNGFREAWERDGLTGAGDTMFRWSEDGSRIEIPLDVASGHLRARLRVARFADGPVEMVLEAAGVVVDRWHQPPRGWTVREVDLGELRGPLVMTLRSQGGADSSGVAVDWVEVQGAHPVHLETAYLARVMLFLLGPPLLVAALLGLRREAAALGALLAWMAAGIVWWDRLGGLEAVATAAVPACLLALVGTVVSRLIERAWPDAADRRTGPIAIAIGIAGVLALSHPFYYYPDVDTHVRMFLALKSNPWLLLDPTQPWARRGDVTRVVGGTRVAIPYAMVFHALAWPLASTLGTATALKTVAACALTGTLLLVPVLARAAGLGALPALLAIPIAAAIPVTTSRLTLALYPTLLGQAALVLLLVHLARRAEGVPGTRATLVTAAFIGMANAVYTASIVMVAAFVWCLAVFEVAGGQWRRAARLVLAWTVATAVVGLMYVRFVPVLLGVMPALGGGETSDAVAGPGPLRLALARASIFFDTVYPILLIPGLIALRTAPARARRVMTAALAAGGGVLVLRFVVTTVLRDAKEVELLVAPVAVTVAAGLAWLWARGRAGQAAAVIGAGAALWWSVLRAASLYAERFVAIGR